MPDGDLLGSDEGVLDEQAQHALAFGDGGGVRAVPQAGQEAFEVVGEFELDLAVGELGVQGVDLGAQAGFAAAQVGYPGAQLVDADQLFLVGLDHAGDRVGGLGEGDPTVATVGGQEILVLHARSPEAGALPLVLNHGYPSSAVEFLDVIGPLTDPAAHGGDPRDAFHVIVPSLPGFGLAPAVREHGWTTARMATAFSRIVHLLGYERYAIQGGDVGAGVAQDMAVADPANVVGVHVNTDMLATAAVLSFAGVTLDPADVDEPQRALVERMSAFVRDALGYIALQGTRPATVGYALDDSPAGQLAWIAEKFDRDGPAVTVRSGLRWAGAV